jgi:hypothetical protein
MQRKALLILYKASKTDRIPAIYGCFLLIIFLYLKKEINYRKFCNKSKMPSIGRFWVKPEEKKHPAIDLYQAILKPEEKNHKESEQYENKNVKNQHFF